jgi:peptidoglycan/xylan/chitin deacetylase (PgdA/CDA1 family)
MHINSYSQKQLAITIDDPTTKETPLLKWFERDSILLKTLDLHGIKAALFVCGMRVDHTEGKALLDKWDANNHILANHSYSHFYYHSKKITSKIFIDDFQKGELLIKDYTHFRKLFRFPFLKEGNTVQKRDSMRSFLKKEGYKNGFVSIDASDWYIDAQLNAALKNNIDTDLTPYKEYYIQHILDRVQYYDSLARLVFRRNIKHTLLIHHSLLNALFLNDLITELKANGWELINADDAFSDEIYTLQPDILPSGKSIIWQNAMLNDSISNGLRYPAEDGTYEKEPFEKYLKQYTIIPRTSSSKGL